MQEKFRVTYRRARVTVVGNKTNRCTACRGFGRVELHHYFYAYPTSKVRVSPYLALENTIPLCYKCHRLADCIRKLLQDLPRTFKVTKALNKRKPKGEPAWSEAHSGARSNTARR